MSKRFLARLLILMLGGLLFWGATPGLATTFTDIRVRDDLVVEDDANISGDLDVTGAADIGGNGTVGGTLVVTGVITATAGVLGGTSVGTFANGTEAIPGMSFTDEPDCGWRKSAANTISMVIAEADIWDYSATTSALTGILTVSGASTFTGNVGCDGGFDLDGTLFALTDETGVLSAVPTTTSLDAWTLDVSTVTSGTGFKIIALDSVMAAGFYAEFLGGNGTVEVFSVKEGGCTTITPAESAKDVDALAITAILHEAGDFIQLTADDNEMTGKYINCLGGAGHDTAVWTVGIDGTTAITSTTATTNSFTITNLATTGGDLVTLVGDSDTMDADTYYMSVLGTESHAAQVFYIGRYGDIYAGGGQDIDLADGRIMVQGYYLGVSTALTGTGIGVKGNARMDVDSAAGTLIGGQFLTGNGSVTTGYDINLMRGVYVGVTKKTGASAAIVAARGIEVVMDWDQITTTTTTLTGARIELQSGSTASAPTNSAGLHITNQNVTGTGQQYDAAILVTQLSNGSQAGFGYGVDFGDTSFADDGVTFTNNLFGTADIRLCTGGTIKNTTDTILELTDTTIRVTGAFDVTGASTYAGTLDPTIVNTAAGGDAGLNLQITGNATAITGTLIGAAIGATNGTADGSTSGIIIGVEAKARAATPAGAGHSIKYLTAGYFSADAKTKSVTNMRGVEISLDGGAGGTTTLATALYICNNSSQTQTTSYGISLNDGEGSGGHKLFTKDILLQYGESISNATNGTVKIDTNILSLGNDEYFDNTTNGHIGISGVVDFAGTGTKVATAGLLHGAGATNQAGAYSLGTGSVKAMSYYLSSTSTSASESLEGFYITTYHGVNATSAAPKGEAGRFRAYLVGDADGVCGAHNTVEMGTGASTTGLTLGSYNNIVFANEVVTSGGTYAGAEAELFLGGTSTDVSGVTSASILRLSIGGATPTLAAQFTVPVISLALPTNLVGADLVVDNTSTTLTCNGKLRIEINGVTYWIPVDLDSD